MLSATKTAFSVYGGSSFLVDLETFLIKHMKTLLHQIPSDRTMARGVHFNIKLPMLDYSLHRNVFPHTSLLLYKPSSFHETAAFDFCSLPR